MNKKRQGNKVSDQGRPFGGLVIPTIRQVFPMLCTTSHMSTCPVTKMTLPFYPGSRLLAFLAALEDFRGWFEISCTRSPMFFSSLIDSNTGGSRGIWSSGAKHKFRPGSELKTEAPPEHGEDLCGPTRC